LEINDRLSQKWPVISIIIDAPKDAKEWENKENKLALLEE
jgi:ferredoxin